MDKTLEQVNEAIRAAAEKHGFETKAEPGFGGLAEIASNELNFFLRWKNTKGTDWRAHRVENELEVKASVRKMGGEPTVEELLKTADEIRRGAELVAELQAMKLTWTETF